jgi:GNAT superfamily N-acetyltransferase
VFSSDRQCSVDLNAFAVEPKYQGHGIGSQKLEHALQLADKAGIRTWLTAFPASHSLYLRHGFKDVDYRDIDMSKFARWKLTGYGIHRSYAMVREPEKPKA